MNKLLVRSLALVAMAFGGSGVRAADMPLKAPPPVVYYSWTGCYVGLNIGENYGRSKTEYGANTLDIVGIGPGGGLQATNNIKLSGLIGGAQVGCNYQVASWVFGLEGDFDATNKDGQEIQTLRPTWSVQVTETWLATARARLGYTVTDKWLWYVTGGGAWTSMRVNNFIPGAVGPLFTSQEKRTVSGWTVGVGTEYAVGYGWSIKSEFLYVNFGTKDFLSPTAPNSFSQFRVKQEDYIWRVGMNYKFGWSPAVVAKY
jgi:outer membrane immunogenic protein